jgi:thioredoxin 2
MRLDPTGVIVTCTGCGSANRLAFPLLNRTTRCARCKTSLPAPDVPLEVGDTAAFEAVAAQSVLPLIVDFWAPWCGPCRMVAPELERVARTNAGRYLVVKVNTDAVTDVAARFSIRSIPTLAIVFGGRELGRVTGVRPASEIEAFAARTISSATSRAS